MTRYALLLLTTITVVSTAIDPQDAPAPTTAEKAPSAKAADVESLDAIIAALYDVISGDAGQERDWDRMRSLFHSEAKLVPVVTRGEKSRARHLTVEDYIRRSGPYLVEKGFHERGISRRVEKFGRIAHVFSTYESRHKASDEEPFVRGINSIQAFNDGGRWWILNIMWDQEREGVEIPAGYLVRGK